MIIPPIRSWLALTLVTLLASAQAEAAPTAVVFDNEDGITGASGTARMLREAGFTVTEPGITGALDLTGTDLVVFGSYIDEISAWKGWFQSQRATLQKFVMEGGVVLHFAARAENESNVSYLPLGYAVTRIPQSFETVHVHQPAHLLLRGFDLGEEDPQLKLGRPHGLPASAHGLRQQRKFSVVLANDLTGMVPALIEGSYGKGRFLITSLRFDKQYRGPKAVETKEFRRTAAQFFTNLLAYVAAVRAGTAAAVEPTPPADLPAPGGWTMVVMPDTRLYVFSLHHWRPDMWEAQADWIVAQARNLNIRYVLHAGDITQHNAPKEWAEAVRIMGKLPIAGIPYLIVGGGHDLTDGDTPVARDTPLSRHFPVAKAEKSPTFGGVMTPGRLENNYHLFEAGGTLWLAIGLEWAPRDRTVEWADKLIREHSDRLVVIVTHAYLYSDGTRYDWKAKGDTQEGNPHRYDVGRSGEGVNDGEELWQKLIGRHENIVLVISGHPNASGQGLLTSVGAGNRKVHQMLVNFLDISNGGNGYLRVLEFMPDGKTVRTRDYSPVLKHYRTEPQSNRTFVIEPLPSPSGK